MSSNTLSRVRVFAASTLLLASFCASAATAPMPAAGDLPPNQVGMTLDGDPVLLAKHKGVAVVVTFWATWCHYCLKELPILSRIQEKGNDLIHVIAVNTEERAVFRKVKRVLSELNLELAYDPDKKAQTAFGVDGIPHMVIIGRDGKIVAVHRGYDESSLESIAADLNRAVAAPAQ